MDDLRELGVEGEAGMGGREAAARRGRRLERGGGMGRQQHAAADVPEHRRRTAILQLELAPPGRPVQAKAEHLRRRRHRKGRAAARRQPRRARRQPAAAELPERQGAAARAQEQAALTRAEEILARADHQARIIELEGGAGAELEGQRIGGQPAAAELPERQGAAARAQEHVMLAAAEEILARPHTRRGGIELEGGAGAELEGQRIGGQPAAIELPGRQGAAARAQEHVMLAAAEEIPTRSYHRGGGIELESGIGIEAKRLRAAGEPAAIELPEGQGAAAGAQEEAALAAAEVILAAADQGGSGVELEGGAGAELEGLRAGGEPVAIELPEGQGAAARTQEHVMLAAAKEVLACPTTVVAASSWKAVLAL